MQLQRLRVGSQGSLFTQQDLEINKLFLDTAVIKSETYFQLINLFGSILCAEPLDAQA